MAGYALVLVMLPLPLRSQDTPRDRAESYLEAVGGGQSAEEHARLYFLALAEWYEEGARAVLTADRRRFLYAVEQEAGVLFPAFEYKYRACWEKRFENPEVVAVYPNPASYLAYVAGQWDGQGSILVNASNLANWLLDIADKFRRHARRVSVCGSPSS